ncbi:hypothetical protein AB0M83_21120 [Amycolatopsis sp. NPDC051106]
MCVVEPGAVATEFANYFGVDERLFAEAGPYAETATVRPPSA